MRRKEKNLKQREEKLRLEEKEKKKARNLSRKLTRRDTEIKKLKEELSGLGENAVQLGERLSKETLKKEKLRKQVAYHRTRKSVQQESISAMKKDMQDLKKANAQLESQLQHAELELELALSNRHQIALREGSHPSSAYTNRVRHCIMKLYSHEVSSHNVSQVIHDVLTTLCQYDVSIDDLPGETFCQQIRQESGVVSRCQVVQEMEDCADATLHSDATSHDQVKYTGYQLTTGQGQHRTAGIIKMSSGQSSEQLEGLNFVLRKLAMLSKSADDCTQHSKKLLSKIKNTMGDGAASQKRFNELLEAYREEILPDVVENWEELDAEVKESMCTMNHMYCQLHALVGFATYADEALQSLENIWRETSGKLGVEKLREFQNKDGEYIWGKGDSATQRLIRTVCNSMAPRGNQQAGCMGEFSTYLSLKGSKRTSLLKPFKGNRFNILFECAAGVYHHRKDIQNMFGEGHHKAGNRLLRAVLADISSPHFRPVVGLLVSYTAM
ncbi:PREDICTED: uncharacterized protein LOC109463788 [Branchiostoma belcheri]|uniref:Uncharacterized protein LOC109463788 n=1 Tax=Branchiostoma belcheri TaxID=7741 RepID=A0A6P4XI47_BRABE|nr:PREDICTED: uncharacterized protein LOC109463788 [Branchiostoma belcheri]